MVKSTMSGMLTVQKNLSKTDYTPNRFYLGDARLYATMLPAADPSARPNWNIIALGIMNKVPYD